jgi:hypothetical protein
MGEYYILVQDDSCHWYVIPSDREDDWNKFIEKEDDLGEIPDYAQSVGGSPSLIKFAEYIIA